MKIQESVLTYIKDNVSTKSKHYITEELFVTDRATKRILAENPASNNANKYNIIGELTDEELQFFVIRQSLGKRISGTERRMQESTTVDIFASEKEIRKVKELYQERSLRFDELCSDYRAVHKYLLSLIRKRLDSEIKSLLQKNSTILKTPAISGSSAGYIFIIVDERKIAIENWYPMGGD